VERYDELLEEWNATRPRPESGIRLIGERWTAESYRLREYLTRNLVPFRWVDADLPEAGALLAAAGTAPTLPVLLLDDGRVLIDPSPVEVAEALGLSATPDVDYHDLIVVGAGPAGLAAAVYGGSEGLRTLIIEAEAPGGQAALSSRIENYLGFPRGVSGAELARRRWRRRGASARSWSHPAAPCGSRTRTRSTWWCSAVGEGSAAIQSVHAVLRGV
jgi:thioredoxin reductase (NADPH)